MAGSDLVCEASEDADGRKHTDELLRSLGERDWNLRRDAVQGLAETASGDLVQQLLSVLRNQHRDLALLNGALQVLAQTPADVVPDLLSLLSCADVDVRTYAALTLGERGDPRAAVGLIAALNDSDANVRMHAVEALGRLRAAAAVDPLMEIVEARDFELAFPALDALIAIGDERIAHRLLPLLNASLLKTLVVEALGHLGDEEVIKPLLDLLGDAEVPPTTVIVSINRIHERYWQRYGDDQCIPQIVRTLASPANVQTLIASAPPLSRAVIGGWARILSWLPGPEATATLVGMLDRPPIDPEVVLALVRKGQAIVPLLLERLVTVTDDGRKAIVEILTRLGDRSAIPALLKTLAAEENEDLLVQAADSLARLADARTYEPLRTLLGHPSPRVRQSAVAAVNSLGHPNTATDLLPKFRSDSALVRESCVRVAAYLGLANCLDALFDCCGDPDPRVRRAAIEVLPDLDDPRVHQRLSQAIRTDTPAVRAAAAVALAKTADQDAAAELLVDALLDGDVWIRYFAIRSLLSIGQHPSAFAALSRLAMADPAMQVRVAAIEALTECGPRALPVLLELSQSPQPDIANVALLSLGSFPMPEVKQVLLAALRSDDAERRTHAVRAMGRTNDSDLVEPLRDCLMGPEARLATEAMLALGQMRLRESALALIDGGSRASLREQCLAALVKVGDSATPALVFGLQTRDLDTRRLIVEALSRIRSAAGLDALSMALEDSQPAIRHAALSALAHIRKVHPSAAASNVADVREGKA